MEKIYNLLNKLENNGFDSYIVGGYVRDKLLNKKSFDIDICTIAKPEDIKKIFPIAKDKGLFCLEFEIDKYHIEITSFRKEINYDGRRPEKVEYTTLQEDLQRRDFTINSILLDSKGNIIDKLDGIKDLNNKVIKTIGDANIKIKEDALRILRAIRLATVLNFHLDKELETAIILNKNNIKNLSIYRKRNELDKIIGNNNFEYGINLIKKYELDKLLNIVIPRKIKYSTNILGIYAQMDINIDNFFNKKELKQIKIFKQYLSKNLTNLDIYNLGYDNLKVIDEIKGSKYLIIYNNLPIKTDRDLNISYGKIKSVLMKKNICYSYIKSDIISYILDGKLNNTSEDIINYINNNY